MKRMNPLPAMLATVLLAALCSCTAGRPPRIPLTEGWSYSLSDPEPGSAQFSPLPEGSLLSLQEVVPGGEGFIWLRKEFSVPGELSGCDLGCYLGRISFADRTYLNGVFVGGRGRPGGERASSFSAWNEARLYELPAALLSAGTNELTVQVWVEGEGSVVAGPFIGTPEDARTAAGRQSFWNSRIQLLFAFFMLMVGIYHLFLFATYPEEKGSAMFALVNFVSVIYLATFYYVEIPGFPWRGLSYLSFQKACGSCVTYLLPFMTTAFVNSFLGRRERPALLAVRAAFALVPMAMLALCPTYRSLHALHVRLMPLLLPPVAYLTGVLVVGAARRKEDALPLLLAFLPVVVAVLFDLFAHTAFRLYGAPYVTVAGWQAVIVVLLFFIAARSAAHHRRAEYLNRRLEQEVEARTEELSRSNARLSETVDELNAAKRLSDRDLQLAVYTQQNFYVREPPVLRGWDVAFHFRPMMGISGDLYDFFTDGESLLGAGLFDVSGHGVASGLVTMLAKTVIDRQFAAGREAPLEEVMARINDQLLAEKGDIENYLTGALLRVTGNRVEFVNAGHPWTFLRDARAGRVSQVRVAGSADFAGCAIGIAGFEPEFRAVGFEMHPGDSLLLYTDGLVESRNPGGEDFGYRRIAEAFALSGAGSAAHQLERVLDAFSAFTEGLPLNDDLTLIVLKKC